MLCMKLIKPEINIDKKKPYSSDLLDRKNFGDSLTRIIKKINESLVLMLDAGWGEGKSTFIKMWRADLYLDNCKTIYFDAFRYDFSDDPFLDLVSEIHSFVDAEFSNEKKLIESNKKFKN